MMKLVTRDTDYAVRALCFIAKKRRVVSVTELVSEANMPKPFLRKILHALKKEGVLKSYKGVGGGFSLAVKPKKIFLVDVIKIFQGPLRLNECIFKKRICPNRESCALKRKLEFVEDRVVSELKSITIESLLK